MSDADQKDPEKVKAELLKEFERGQLNREEAITELDHRKRLADESAETFAHKVTELVKLAYPTFADDVRRALAKDYYVRGLSSELQLAVKSIKGFTEMTVKNVAEETVRLELAGVGEIKSSAAAAAAAVNACDGMVDAIAEKVLERLSNAGITSGNDEAEAHSADYRYDNFRGRSRNRGRGRGRGRRRGAASQNRAPKQCRLCQSSDHLLKDCPTRFCQACGGRGHD